MKDFCYWSIGNKSFADILQVLVKSFREVGMEEDFIAFSDKNIEGAKVIPITSIDKKCFLFKFTFLKQLINFDYKTFVFLDADSLFVRKVPDLHCLMTDGPAHAFLECDCTYPSLRKSWWGCPLPEYVQMMRDCGVTSQGVYNVNAGFFMVDRHAIDLFCSFVDDFWQYALSQGYAFTEEAPLAYAIQMLSKDPEKHLLVNHFDIWATDWRGEFSKELPSGKPWKYRDWMRDNEYTINPAIVHVAKSKHLLH